MTIDVTSPDRTGRRRPSGTPPPLPRSIGTTGMRALSPFIHTSTRDLWQLTLIDEAQP